MKNNLPDRFTELQGLLMGATIEELKTEIAPLKRELSILNQKLDRQKDQLAGTKSAVQSKLNKDLETLKQKQTQEMRKFKEENLMPKLGQILQKLGQSLSDK